MIYAQTTQKIKLGRKEDFPVVVLPLSDYERMREDLEMAQSKNLSGKIAKARKEKKLYSSVQVKKMLGLK